MFQNNKIILVLPCYNEEKGLLEIFNKKPALIDEVIVVDNNSTDGTADIARRFGAKVLFIKEKGYGLACRNGISRQSPDGIIVMMDGDNSYPVSEIEKLLNFMEKNNYDFLSGCRFPLTDKKAMPLIKRLSNGFISHLIRILFSIKLIDSQSGMLVFKGRLLKEILSFNPGMGFSQEIKIKYSVRSGEVKFRSLQDGIKVLCDLFIFRIKTI